MLAGLMLYDQTTLTDRDKGTHGDCARACVCTLAQIAPARLPHPIARDGGWNRDFHRALRTLGLALRQMDRDSGEAPGCRIFDENWGGFELPRVVIAAGPSPRGPWWHSVIWDRLAERVVHDPHPSRDGIAEVRAYDYLAPFPCP